MIQIPAKFRRKAGFTVVEVMMAACILTVGFIGLIEAVAVTTTMMDHARRQSLATQILDFEIEELYLSDWATISAMSGTLAISPIDSQFDAARLAVGDDGTANAPVRFSMSRTVNADPVTNIKEINFTVTWVVYSNRLVSGSRLTTTYRRSNTAWYGKNGLHLSYRRS